MGLGCAGVCRMCSEKAKCWAGLLDAQILVILSTLSSLYRACQICFASTAWKWSNSLFLPELCPKCSQCSTTLIITLRSKAADSQILYFRQKSLLRFSHCMRTQQNLKCSQFFKATNERKNSDEDHAYLEMFNIDKSYLPHLQAVWVSN